MKPMAVKCEPQAKGERKRSCGVGMLRGQKAVRAQAAILYKIHAVFGVNHNRVFCTDALFIRTENTVGARSAQLR